MKRFCFAVSASILLACTVPAFAASSTEVLANCLVDNLTGKERKNLSKWVFFAIAAHPEIKTYSSVRPEDLQETDRYVASLITRLLTVDCPNEVRKANSEDPLAFQNSFELVGKVAMQELLTNQDVMQTISNYAKYLDQEKINKALTGE